MWKFSGAINYTCNNCHSNETIPVNDFNIECVGGSDRQMGAERIHEIAYEFDCPECDSNISLSFEASEYPVEFLNFVINNSSGATTEGEPYIEHLREIYCARDLFELYESISELVTALKWGPELLRELTSREFEEVVAEIFRSKGFEVELTKRTRDGGKDIIAFNTDMLGIKNKYFIECKRYAEDNSVGVDIVRALQGVKNTKDGPNKVILVSTSHFTADTKKFVESEASSKWDISLADYSDITGWLETYE